MKRERQSKLLALFLTFAMVLSLAPALALAEGDGEAVAKIGSSEYETIMSAVTAAGNVATTIQVVASTNENVVIPSGADITLELASGVTLANDTSDNVKAHTILNNGTLTINGSGTVDNVSHGKGAVYNTVGATATLNGCTYTRSQENGQSAEDNGGNSWYTIKNFGTMTINEGVTVEQNNGQYSSLVANGWQNYSSAVNGSSEPMPTAEAKLTINGGTFSGGLNTIKNDDYAILVVNGGSFVNVAQHALMNWNVATINGGTFETQGDKGKAAVWCGYDNDTYNKGTLTITDGTFTAANGAPSVQKGYSGATVKVTGGTYSSDVSPFVPDGYETEGSGNTVTVNKATSQTDAHVAEVDGQYFKTVEAAISAAPAGATVNLLKNADVSSVIIRRSVTLDLQTHTLNLVGTDGKFFGLAVIDGTTRVTNGTVIDKRTEDINTGSRVAFAVQATGVLSTDNVTITSYCPDKSTDSYNYILQGNYGGEIIVNAGTVIQDSLFGSNEYDTYGCVGLAVFGTEDAIGRATVDGGKIATRGFAVSGNGTSHNTEITIKGNAELTSESQAIYHPQQGTLNIESGTITGATGIEMRAGTLNVTGGVITGTGSPSSVTPNGNGSTSDGAGIAVAQHTTKLPITVNIQGGSISGYTALYENNPQNNDPLDIDKIQINVTGGDFRAINGGTNALYSEDTKISVSGGTFSSQVPIEYCAPNFTPTNRRADGTYTVEEAIEGHEFGEEWKYDENEHYHLCTICEEERGSVGAHTFTWVVDREATCTEKGSRHEECTVCGYKKAAVELPAVPHTFSSQWASDDTDHWHGCEDCDAISDKASHTFTWVVDREATCTEKGSQHEECTVCGYKKAAVELPAVPHTFGSQWASDDADHWHGCEDCDAISDKASHTFTWVVDQEATATDAGAKHEECTVCGYKKAAIEIPALGTETENPPDNNSSDRSDNAGSDTNVNNPQTGDTANWILWIVLLVLAGSGLTATLLYSKKRS